MVCGTIGAKRNDAIGFEKSSQHSFPPFALRIPLTTSEEEIKELVEDYGEVEAVQLFWELKQCDLQSVCRE